MGAPQALSAVVAGIAATAVMVAGAGAVDIAAARPAAAAGPEVVKPGGTSAASLAAREAAEAATADAQRADDQPGGEVPAPPPPAPPVELDPQQQALNAASAAAAEGDKPVEVAELTDEQSLTTANPDGTFTTSTSTQPVRFKSVSGNYCWRARRRDIVMIMAVWTMASEVSILVS